MKHATLIKIGLLWLVSRYPLVKLIRPKITVEGVSDFQWLDITKKKRKKKLAAIFSFGVNVGSHRRGQ